MPFLKNHNCFANQDQHGKLPTGEPYPPSPRPPDKMQQVRVPCLRPLRYLCKRVGWGSVQTGLTLRPLLSEAWEGPRPE